MIEDQVDEIDTVLRKQLFVIDKGVDILDKILKTLSKSPSNECPYEEVDDDGTMIKMKEGSGRVMRQDQIRMALEYGQKILVKISDDTWKEVVWDKLSRSWRNESGEYAGLDVSKCRYLPILSEEE